MKEIDFGKLEYLIDLSEKILIIDHHSGESDFGDFKIIQEKASATTALLYNVYKEIEKEYSIIKPSKDVLEAILVGVITDTSGFRNSNTDIDALKISLKALEYGADLHKIINQTLSLKSPNTLELEKITIERIEYFHNNEIAFSYLLFSDDSYMNRESGEHETIANMLRDIEGVKIGILIREVEEGLKIGLRSSKEVNSKKIAEQFNGGGHINAAGALILSKDLDKYKKEIIDAAINELERIEQ